MSKAFVESFESLPKDYAESGTGAGTGAGAIQEPPYPPSQGGGDADQRFVTNDAKAKQRQHPSPQAPANRQQVEDSQPPGPEQPPAGVDVESGLRIWAGMSKAAKCVVGAQPFDTWIRPISAKGILNGVLYLQIPSNDFSHVPARYEFDQYLPADVREIRILNAMGVAA
jgi:hypothetical protein